MIALLCTAMKPESVEDLRRLRPHREVDDERREDRQRTNEDEDGESAGFLAGRDARLCDRRRRRDGQCEVLRVEPDRIAPSPSALPALKVSTACIHFGICPSCPPLGRPRHE